ncbi:MAG TPA: GH92 family glycosyl hydrolase [Flavisolibacter sp.]|nr:GH92 family glycosyl hydrolase [Flavisolibacter sp.]
MKCFINKLRPGYIWKRALFAGNKLAIILFVICLPAIKMQAQTKYAYLVNPFIGTGGHGHTYPGASMPFGMMQLSPDTRLEGWDGCGGYHYTDSIIYGFSHTHLSGTGIADYCDILLMPFTGEVKWKNKEYASSFSHKNEKAHAGYYEVLLDKDKIKAALTTSIRSGMHEYSFPQTASEGKVLLDLQHRDQVLESSLEVVNAYEVRGMRRSRSWANDQSVFFYMKFEKPIKEYGLALNDTLQKGMKTATGINIKSYFSFDLAGDKKIHVKVGISGVSMENAKLNLETEIPGWDFNKLKSAAEDAWNKELGKIDVIGGSNAQQEVFYTALYHASLAPNIYTDINGQFRGTDLKIHHADNFTNYSVFSLWDTHRALHPLMTIINRKRTNDWINTFLAQYKAGGMLPVWELSGNETFCMIGYHSVPVIVDAYQKGIRDFDAQLALKAMISYAQSDRFGLNEYGKIGFVSNDIDHESASKTVEYAYDDWCISQFAKWLGNDSIYHKYSLRAQNYKNLFDPSSKHIRGKVQGFWYSPFKATEVNNFFTEGNSWHYSFTAQQDIDGLIKLHGGREAFGKKLDELFTTSENLSGRDQADVTGLIGQYAQGNEPSHHMAYLFNYAGKPWRTQELIHKICNEFYTNNPDGLIGNEDCGQMSAWYVLSAMGFYEVTPGSGIYALGTPEFDKVSIHLENGKIFNIKAENRSSRNYYVNNITLNGKALPETYMRHTDLENGGALVFKMSDRPNYTRGIKDHDIPHSSIENSKLVAVPFFDMPTNKFKQTMSVKMGTLDTQALIYYRVGPKDKQETGFIRYSRPFTINNTSNISFYSEKNGIKSAIVTQTFYKVPSDRTITVMSEVNPMYTGGGDQALIDGITGTQNWKTGEWQSYFAKDFVALIDLQSLRPITHVGIHVLQDVSPWIVYPKEVLFETSTDGKVFQPLITVENKISTEDKGPVVQELGIDVKTQARYVKVTAKNGGVLPAWHESAGQPTHIFIDEIIIR